MKKIILMFLLALVMLQSTVLLASAAPVLPDLERDGSITFQMVKNGTKLDGGNLRLARVGDIQENDSNYFFVLIDSLKHVYVDLTKPTDHDVAEKLLTEVKAKKVTHQVAAIKKGEAVFDLVPAAGLYLVWQNDSDATKGYTPIAPFLISIPRMVDGQYIYDVISKPKVPLQTKPTVPPTTKPTVPPPPRLPQTGQLNWPVPVMASAGFVLLALGVMLCGSRKRLDDET